MTAGASKTINVISSGDVTFGMVRHCIISDFLSELYQSFPLSDKDGGSLWFSYLNNSSESKSGFDCRYKKDGTPTAHLSLVR